MKRLVLLAGLVLLGLSAWGLRAQQTWQDTLTLPIGGGSLAIADLNGDRNPDIVTTGTGTVVVYRGDGRGRFSQAPGSPFPAGNNPSDIALGDFNEDGRLDVAVANHETTYLTVLLADRGGLSPASHVTVPSRPHPHGVAVGDFTGDRHLDLAVESWEADMVLVVPGNGKGGFAESRPVAVGRKPYWKLRAADLNNDGKADLVTTNMDGSSVSVLCSDGSGALRPSKDVAVSRSPFAIAIGDVNGDRYPDLAVAHRWGSVDPNLDRVTVLTGSGDCVFTASPESPMKAGTSPTDVAIGDIDGDGIGDIAVANMGSNDVSVFLGGRSGLRPMSGSPVSTGKLPLALALHDLNGDRRADIVTGGRDVSVILSRPAR